MKTTTILGVICLVGLTGCVSLPEDQQFNFSNSNAKFSFMKRGCVIEEGRFTDLTGKGQRNPYVKVLAVTDSGETVGEWSGYCDTVIPNGTSQCRLSGPRRASNQCANYDRYKTWF